jgi:hypothetical protein
MVTARIDRIMHTKNKEPVKWDLLRHDIRHTDKFDAKKRIDAIVKPLYESARKLGYNPKGPLEALLMLRKIPAQALEILTEIFEAQGHNKTKAEQMAQTQIDVLWDTSMRKIDIADSKPKR